MNGRIERMTLGDGVMLAEARARAAARGDGWAGAGNGLPAPAYFLFLLACRGVSRAMVSHVIALAPLETGQASKTKQT
jgi:hypothetical protein